MSFDAERVQKIIRTVPNKYRGPGGAVAVLKDGNLVAQHVWGYADLDKRIPMTPQVVFPICSITKQFVSALLIDLAKNPPAAVTDQQGTFDEQMAARLREILPQEVADGMTVDNLVDMCSGLRDYWALCTLHGSRPDTPYLIEEHNADMLRRIKSLQFKPGTEFSYCNTNFNVVERLLEHVTKTPLEQLLTERIFGPAEMTTARMVARTDRLPPPIVGYEGTEKTGFFEAPNNIEWSADAGMGASLADMIAYERWFDSKYTDPNHGARIEPREYKNGSMARYRYGLAFSDVEDVPTVGHGGGLRGFRLQRRYVPSERLSVIVMFNHHASPVESAEYVIKRILNLKQPPASDVEPGKEWFGSYLDQDTQLSVRVEKADKGKIKLHYIRAPVTLRLTDPQHAKSAIMEARIDGDTVHVQCGQDNRVLEAKRLEKNPDLSQVASVRGTYECSEIEAKFICEGEDDMMYGLFNGCFGRGPPHLMTYLGGDVWVLADPRAMDDAPPGDWTVVFVRDEQGKVIKATIGCWLARKLEFVRVE